MLPVAFISSDHLIAATGGFAAAIAIGAFVGQALGVFASLTEDDRRLAIAGGGLSALALMIGLILLSAKGR